MKHEAWLFVICTVFLVLVTPAYWLIAGDWTGTSALVIQGTAGTREEHVKYSWNYALLLAKGPTREALVPSPVMRGMTEGKIVRVEELTRVDEVAFFIYLRDLDHDVHVLRHGEAVPHGSRSDSERELTPIVP